MICIRSVREEYRNDLTEVVRLFYPADRVFFSDASYPGDDSGDGEELIHIEMGLHASDGILSAEALSGRSRGFCSSAEFSSYSRPGDAIACRRMEKWTLKCALYRLLSEMNGVRMPWGALTGIRPTKLCRDLIEICGPETANAVFSDTFGVSDEKRALASRICEVQRPILASTRSDEIDLYFHIPYCKSRCLYCSFGTELVAGAGTLRSYSRVLKEEIRRSAAIVRGNGCRIRCSYFGGGTPSILPPEILDDLLNCILEEYGTLGYECTFEAGRPDTIDAEKLAVLKRYGIQRISVNPQSMHDETMHRIGRGHTAGSVSRAFWLARNMGFARINMDLIMGLPGETFEDMRESIDAVLSLSPENITIHTLALKRSSRLKRLLADYSMSSAQDVENAVRYGYRTLSDAGYRPYYMYRQKYMQGNLENVGYAKAGSESMYNVDIMEETVGIMAHGAGSISKAVSSGRDRIERIAAPKDTAVYSARLDQLIRMKEDLFRTGPLG